MFSVGRSGGCDLPTTRMVMAGVSLSHHTYLLAFQSQYRSGDSLLPLGYIKVKNIEDYLCIRFSAKSIPIMLLVQLHGMLIKTAQ